MRFNQYAFETYCARVGIKLLRDDLRFIQEQLRRIPSDRHRAVMSGFTKEWLRELQIDENSPQAQNLGRRAANSWLRDTCCARY